MPNKTRTESKSKARTEANIKPQEFLWREGTLIGFIMKDFNMDMILLATNNFLFFLLCRFKTLLY
jgi:hypothetical protein